MSPLMRIVILAVVGVASASCRDAGDAVVVREIVMHVPASCKVEQAFTAYAIYKAYGDFQADPPPAEDAFLSDVGQALANLPADTRALAADVSEGAFYWTGYAEVPEAGPIDLLLWRSGSACTLSGDFGKRIDPAFGAIDARRVLVAGGSPPPGASIPDSFVADLATGITTRLKVGLLTPRAGATLTGFGGGVLVAGGRATDSGAPLAPGSAEVYAPGDGGSPGDFDGKPIPLGNPRADHGAIVLTTGESLLVGGAGADGKPLASLEVVDPVKRQARTQGLVQLQTARIKPSVVRLASGEILVGGGSTLAKQADGSERLVPADRIEFLAPDARSFSHKSETYRAGRETKFVALPAGGALMVNADEISGGINTVYVISAAGIIEPAPGIIAGKVDRVHLFTGAEGAPVLWTGDRWLRWKPWSAEFVALTEALTARPGPDSEATASPDSGLAIWLTDGGARLAGLRFAARGPFSPVRPVLVDGFAGLSPDRMINERRNDEQRLRFTKQFGLTLEVGATAFVTDATFAKLALDAELPTGEAPLFVLREPNGTELEVGGPSCPAVVPQGVPSRMHIERDAESVRASVNDGPLNECPSKLSATSRVSLGVRGAAGLARSTVRNLVVVRRW